MARQLGFNTVRVIFQRDDEDEDDAFFMSVLVDGKSIKDMEKEKQLQAIEFAATSFMRVIKAGLEKEQVKVDP